MLARTGAWLGLALVFVGAAARPSEAVVTRLQIKKLRKQAQKLKGTSPETAKSLELEAIHLHKQELSAKLSDVDRRITYLTRFPFGLLTRFRTQAKGQRIRAEIRRDSARLHETQARLDDLRGDPSGAEAYRLKAASDRIQAKALRIDSRELLSLAKD
jgi:hypothetical protein